MIVPAGTSHRNAAAGTGTTTAYRKFVLPPQTPLPPPVSNQTDKPIRVRLTAHTKTPIINSLPSGYVVNDSQTLSVCRFYTGAEPGYSPPTSTGGTLDVDFYAADNPVIFTLEGIIYFSVIRATPGPAPPGSISVPVDVENSVECRLEVIRCQTSQTSCTIESLQLKTTSGKDLEENPNAGGGKRVFAEISAVSAALEDKVSVVVTTARPDELVRLKVYDVDDPSEHLLIDPNGPAGNDNISGSAGTFVDSGTRDINVETRPDNNVGTAVTTLRVTTQPGDNFKVIAACGGAALPTENEIESIGSSGGVASSPLLTVWRTLHLEVDRMKPVEDNFVEVAIASETDLWWDWYENAVVPWLAGRWVKDLFTRTAIPDLKRFERKRAFARRIGDSTAFEVRAGHNGNIIRVAGRGTPPSFAGVTLRLYDDDDANDNDFTPDGDALDVTATAPRGEPLDMPNTELLAALFTPAYIVVRTDTLANPTPEAPFARNLANTGSSIYDLIRSSFDNENKASPQLWVKHVLQGYQWMEAGDGDPDNENGDPLTDKCTGLTRGIVKPRGVSEVINGRGAIIFQESHREEGAPRSPVVGAPAISEAHTVAHEVGHLLGADHCYSVNGITTSDGDLMSSRSDRRESFGPCSIRALRKNCAPGEICARTVAMGDPGIVSCP
jgi:hypothetical protein